MSTATRVPETSTMSGDDLSMDDARTTLRQFGGRKLLWEAFRRFRYGDGMSHSRALGFQIVLATIPTTIAFVGLATTVQQDQLAAALQEVILSVTPGTSDEVVRETLAKALEQGATGGLIALVLGAAVALFAMTMAMGQIERGANRIYGVQRDRSFPKKYGRALILVIAAGIPGMLAFVLIVAGGVAAQALATTYGWSDTTERLIAWGRWPIGVLSVLVTIMVLFRWAPRRHQPAFSWMWVGAAVALGLWLALSGLLSLYVSKSASFGQIYGPLTAVMALLLWAQLSAIALFLGMAFAAQLEAVHAGVTAGADPDPEKFRTPAARRVPLTTAH
jgi:YihY family inner membrane protein